MEVFIQKGDILELEVDCLVYPGNSAGTMEDEFGETILEMAGEKLAEEATARAPVAVGAATIFEIEGLRSEYLIYAPVMVEAGEKIIVENVRRCTRASLVATCARGFDSVALPIIEPNSDEVSVAETSRAMVDELRAFKTDHEFSVYLVGTTQAVINTVHRCIDNVR